jgi:sigma54-dependent transcription regulator
MRLAVFQPAANADALAHHLRFASDPATLWPGNLRDLQASCSRMAVPAERGRWPKKRPAC